MKPVSSSLSRAGSGALVSERGGYADGTVMTRSIIIDLGVPSTWVIYCRKWNLIGNVKAKTVCYVSFSGFNSHFAYFVRSLWSAVL